MEKNKLDRTLYSSPFCAGYWRSASRQGKSLFVLASVALLLALQIAVSAFFIPVGENLRIYFTYLITSVSAIISGPFLAVASGAASDLLGFLVHPTGFFFPGYMLSSMMGGLIYALFLYRQRLSIARIFFCKLCINLFVNIALNSLWSAMMFGKAYYYFLAKSVVKNALMLPIEVVVLVVVLQIMLPVLARLGLTPPQPQGRIPLLSKRAANE